MSVSYRIEAEQQLVRVTARGVVTFADWSATFVALSADRLLPDSAIMLIDFSDAIDLWPRGGLRQAAIQTAMFRHRGVSRVAAVAKNGVVHDSASQFAVLSDMERQPVAVFRDVPSAIEWLQSESVD